MVIRDGGNTEKTVVHGVTQDGWPTPGEGWHTGTFSALCGLSPADRKRVLLRFQLKGIWGLFPFFISCIRSIITDPNLNFKKLVNVERMMEIQSHHLQTAQ